MPKAFIAHLHYCVIKATQEELTSERAYLFETNGIPFTLDVKEIQRTSNGLIRCTGVSSTNLHRFEADTHITPEEQEPFEEEHANSFATNWFKEHENTPAPGIFRSSSNISATRSYAAYALSEEDRAAAEESLTHYPHVFVRQNGSYNLTMVKPGDYLVFPDDKWISIRQPPSFHTKEAIGYWNLATL